MNEYKKIISKIKESDKEVFNGSYVDGKNILVKVADLSEDTISLLVKWRNECGDWFDSKFDATFENTKKWLNDKILNDKQRILFLIIFNNQKIGHFGLDCYNEKENSIFITDVIRGEKGFAPGLMEIIFKNYLDWIQKKLKISIIKLRVFQDDVKAIELYKKCDFKKKYSIPMCKKSSIEGWKWIEMDNLEKSPERYFDVMEFR